MCVIYESLIIKNKIRIFAEIRFVFADEKYHLKFMCTTPFSIFQLFLSPIKPFKTMFSKTKTLTHSAFKLPSSQCLPPLPSLPIGCSCKKCSAQPLPRDEIVELISQRQARQQLLYEKKKRKLLGKYVRIGPSLFS